MKEQTKLKTLNKGKRDTSEKIDILPKQLVASTCSFKKSTHIFFTGSIWYWLAAFSRDWTLLLFTNILQEHKKHS